MDEKFKKRVEEYMLCDKKTLAELLALRDIYGCGLINSKNPDRNFPSWLFGAFPWPMEENTNTKSNCRIKEPFLD